MTKVTATGLEKWVAIVICRLCKRIKECKIPSLAFNIEYVTYFHPETCSEFTYKTGRGNRTVKQVYSSLYHMNNNMWDYCVVVAKHHKNFLSRGDNKSITTMMC